MAPKKSNETLLHSIDEKDQISKLPDKVLVEILSKLDMKYAVQTSFLSRRWRWLWKSVQKLQFNSQIYYSPKSEKERVSNFERFVTMVLIFQSDLEIHRFSIMSPDYEISTVDLLNWIVCLLMHCRLQELHLDILKKNEEMWLPGSIFTSNSLRKLEVCVSVGRNNGWSIQLPSSTMDLPNLIVLKLRRIVFNNKNLTNKFFSSCPVLEELSLIDVEFRTIDVVNLSYPKLSSFKIDNHVHHSGCKFRMHAPGLQSFICKDHLTLSAGSIEVISPDNIADAPAELGALKCLSLETCFSTDSIRAIAYWINISPNIESFFLEISQPVARYCPEAAGTLLQECVFQKLETIQVKGVVGCEFELTLIEALLKNNKLLKKLVVYTTTHNKLVREFARKLLMLPRASSDLKILVY